MNKWVIGGAFLTAASVGIYFALPARTQPAPVIRERPRPALGVATPVPTAPVVLAQVVDVTDIDPLLDPPAVPISEMAVPAGPTLTAVGYEDPAAQETQPAPVATPIPRADESETPAVEVAPRPREVDPSAPGSAG